MDILHLFLGLFLVLFGVSVFVSERILVVLAGICALIAGVAQLMRVL